MMKIQRFSVLSLVMVLLVSMFTFVQPAAAARRNKTWEYATYGLGALAAYSLIKGKTTNALIFGAGAVYSNSRARKARRDHRRNRHRLFDDRLNEEEESDFDR